MNKRNKPHLLLVDDERNTREVLEKFLRLEYKVTLAEDGQIGLNLLKRNNYDVVLTDMQMPGAGGMDILNAIMSKEKPFPCVVFTAYGSVEVAVNAMKHGAFDFVTKPVNFDQLEIVLRRAVESHRLKAENRALRKKLDKKFDSGNIIGNSNAMREVLETIEQIAPTKSTVLITGESGAGKELVAQALHQHSGRTGKFVPVHCAALSDTLLESELFGHEKGAFTGALEEKKGRFELADDGTLFLDEIGEIDHSTQVKLLRALESRCFERVGGVETIHTNTRVVAATNRDLAAMVEEGTFREDLFFRLDVINIKVPTLRERYEDIPLLAKHFIDEFALENNKDIESISEDAISVLTGYRWKGNIRELRNCIERMVVLSRKPVLDIDNIPNHIKSGVEIKTSSSEVASSGLDLDNNEKILIIRALEECNGNRTHAAEKLGISRRTLHRKLHTYNID